MSRWEPGARERLADAALELCAERGYDRVTVAEIAAHAGVTERTFFRYFADKREVLFYGSARLEELLTSAVTGAAESALPLDAIIAALEQLTPLYEERRARSKKRTALVLAHPELRERELIKLATLASAIARVLRERGVEEPAASLAAETGIAVFKIAFQEWVDDRKRRDFTHHVHAARDALDAVTKRARRRV